METIQVTSGGKKRERGREKERNREGRKIEREGEREKKEKHSYYASYKYNRNNIIEYQLPRNFV